MAEVKKSEKIERETKLIPKDTNKSYSVTVRRTVGGPLELEGLLIFLQGCNSIRLQPDEADALADMLTEGRLQALLGAVDDIIEHYPLERDDPKHNEFAIALREQRRRFK